jgi:stage IV sporulation protein FB
MLIAPQPSPYDLQFSVLGFPVRVSWTFWLMGAVLGWGWSQGMDAFAIHQSIDTPGAGVMLLIWIFCVFLSILVHELGHALAWRRYGQNAHIVLYHFGGLAINDSMSSWDGARRHRTSAVEDLVVSAAGPLAQLALALVVWTVGLAIQMPMDLTRWINSLGADLPYGTADTIALYGLFDALLWTSTAWAILNLAPIFPLDGGQILMSLLTMSNVDQPRRTAHLVSAVLGGLLGFFLMTSGQSMAGLMFVMLAVNNWQQMQDGRGIY